MKKIIVSLMSVLLILSLLHFSYGTEDDISYLYSNESGDLVESDTYELDDDAVLLDNEEDYNNLLDGSDYVEEDQEELKKYFEEQQAELKKYTSGEHEEKLVVTEVLSDVKSQYTSDYSYCYVINYQVARVRTSDGTETPAVIILSYDITHNKNVKPVKVGDTVYGYLEYVSNTDSTFNMVNHGLTDSKIAFVSISNQDRTLGIIMLSIFTILLLLLYAGKKGAKLLIPLFIVVDLFFIVFAPEVELGRNIILLASLISLEFIVLIAVLKNGWSRKTIVAILSSIIVVVLVTTLGILFGNANGFTGKGILSEEHYDLLTNVYYIDYIFKSTVDLFDIYVAIILFISSVVSVSISSKITELSEKYAGSEGMINNIIEEAKAIIAEYPFMLAIIIFALYLPTYMITIYNHPVVENIINAESLVTYLAIALLTIISSVIIAPITAVVSYLLMGKVTIKQISDQK